MKKIFYNNIRIVIVGLLVLSGMHTQLCLADPTIESIREQQENLLDIAQYYFKFKIGTSTVTNMQLTHAGQAIVDTIIGSGTVDEGYEDIQTATANNESGVALYNDMYSLFDQSRILLVQWITSKDQKVELLTEDELVDLDMQLGELYNNFCLFEFNLEDRAGDNESKKALLRGNE